MKNNLSLLALLLPFFIKAQVPSILKDLSPGSASTTVVQLYAVPNNDVLFSASTNSSTTSGIYVSDGSTAGTQILKSFGNGKNLSTSSFLPYNGKVYLNAGTSYTAAPLWRTDGTTAGTDSVPIQGLTSAGLNGIRTMTVFLNLIFMEGYGNKL